MLDAGRWILDAGPWTLDPGPWTLDAGLWMLHFGGWSLGTGHCLKTLIHYLTVSEHWTLFHLSVSEQNQKPVSDSS